MNSARKIDECIKIAADRQMELNSKFINKFTEESSGLEVLVLNGYSRDNPTFYNVISEDKIKFKGKTSNLSNITEATRISNFINIVSNNEKDIKISNTPLSVQWQGYFIPDKTGLWTFNISTNANAYAYLWRPKK